MLLPLAIIFHIISIAIPIDLGENAGRQFLRAIINTLRTYP